MEFKIMYRIPRDPDGVLDPIYEAEVRGLETKGELIAIWSEHSREQRFDPDIVINVNDVVMIKATTEEEE